MRLLLKLRGLALPTICLTSLCLMTSLVLSLATPLLPHAHAETFAVVDVARILAESAPAKAGEAHMQNVENILQKTMDDLQAVYKGQENTLAAQKALREGYKTLDKQLALENKAVQQVLLAAIEKAVKSWRSKNKKYHAVINSQMLLDSDSSMDVTPAILQEMEKHSVTFAELPKVRLNPPSKPVGKQPAVKQQAKPAAKPVAKPATNQPAKPVSTPPAATPAAK